MSWVGLDWLSMWLDGLEIPGLAGLDKEGWFLVTTFVYVERECACVEVQKTCSECSLPRGELSIGESFMISRAFDHLSLVILVRRCVQIKFGWKTMVSFKRFCFR